MKLWRHVCTYEYVMIIRAQKMSGWRGIINVILFCLFDEFAQAYKWINFENFVGLRSTLYFTTLLRKTLYGTVWMLGECNVVKYNVDYNYTETQKMCGM